MAGLKPAKVTRFFRTKETLTDDQIVACLKAKGVKTVAFGKGGFPTHDVFHLDDWCNTWIGSRLDGYEGRVLAFFSEQEDDPIFTAALSFSNEITGDERNAITSALADARRAREVEETTARIARTEKARAGETVGI